MAWIDSPPPPSPPIKDKDKKHPINSHVNGPAFLPSFPPL